jgi:electron transport complex protein RnfC
MQVLLGHPMNGRKLFSSGSEVDPYDVLVPEDELLLTCLAMDAPAVGQVQACISCGWCAEVCPTRLRPAEMYRLCKRGGPADVLLPQLNWCLDCGLCSYVCPSSLPLTQTFRQMTARFERILK